MIQTSRRSLLKGLISLVAAPAIVRAESIMPVSAPKLLIQEIVNPLPSGWGTLPVIDKLLHMPVNLMGLTAEAQDQVMKGTHPRYRLATPKPDGPGFFDVMDIIRREFS